MIELIIFDVDGTLAKSSSLQLLPNVKEFFQLVYQNDCAWKPKLAIATNQGGVGMRYWMERDHFGKPDKFPSQASIDERLHNLLRQLGVNGDLPVYVAYRYKNKLGQWSPVPPDQSSNPRWQSEWRKPGPGMLLQAMRDAGVSPENAIYVGDRDEDQKAAQAAGCAFIHAQNFFDQDWSACQGFDTAIHEIAQATARAPEQKDKRWKLPSEWWH